MSHDPEVLAHNVLSGIRAYLGLSPEAKILVMIDDQTVCTNGPAGLFSQIPLHHASRILTQAFRNAVEADTQATWAIEKARGG